MTQPLLSQLIGLSPEQHRAVLERVRQRATGSTAIPRLDRSAAAGELFPGSFGQDRLWFLWRLAPASTTYHVSWCYEVAGGLEAGRLAAAVDALVVRHEALRTTLHEQDGQIVQRVGPPWRCGLTAAPATREQAVGLAAAAARELFDLSAGPLLRARAWELAPDQHLVSFTAHHVVIDEWSRDIFERELWALYAAGGDTASCELPELTVQYADYAAWHRGLVAGQADADLAYWRQALDGATPVCPVPDHPAPEHTEFSGETATATVPASALDWLAAARSDAGTDFVAFFAVWCLFLARHTGQRDLTVGTLVSGRSHRDTATMIGFFVNTLALRVRIDPATDLPGYLRQVQAVVLDAFAHQDIPFEHVVRAVAPRRAAAHNPLFRALFSYAPTDWSSRTTADGLKLTTLPVARGGSHFDLSLTAARTRDGLALRLEYSTDLYDRATIAGYLHSLTDLLAALADRPAAPLRAFLEPTPREAALLAAWNQAATAPAPAAPLHDLITAQARATPDALAIDADDTRLTYAQLDRRSTALARRLRRAGTRDGDIIGMHLPPTAAAITVVLAVWKAGAAFLPLDPDLPPARITTMIADAAPVLIVTDTPTLCPRLDFLLTAGDDENGDGNQDGDKDVSLPAVGPDHLAYLMYTSGSTGQPKAVMIQHRGVTNHAAAQIIPQLRAAAGEDKLRMLTGTSAFISDFSIVHLATLADGHTLVVLTREQRQDPRYLVGLAADPARAVTAMNCTTSQLQLYAESGLLDSPHPPRMVAFGGEACPPDLWATLRAHPAITAINGYGPTEATVETTIAYVAESPVPLIGRPCGNARVHLLDEEQRSVPPGAIGELCIAGPGVGPGYLGHPAQTAAAFIPDPAGPPGSRLYRTGDLARFTPAGLLEYHGRNDHQLKILGQRIEPEEVETALRAHPAVTAAAVTARHAAAGLQLTAHIIPAAGTDPDPAAIHAWLAERLPPPAVPARYAIATDLPLTPGGKLDRKALAQATVATARSVSPPPTTPAEQQIAQIWAGLLSTDPANLGIHDDFFALGGHSLLAARLALRISADLRADIPLHQVFANPTIARQAAWIGEHAPAAAPIPRLDRAGEELVPASFAQERLWFLWRLAPGSPAYHVSWCYQADGLDVAALAAAIDAMIARHEILRTTLHEHDNQIVQRVSPPWQCALAAADATPAQAAAAKTATADLFDLSAGPLLRVRAWRTGPAAHLLLFTAHHVVMDEWSLDIFERELWALYAAGGDMASCELPELTVQYGDYATWHRSLVAGQADADLAYWRQALDGATPASPPPDRTAPDHTSFAGDYAQVVADPAVADWLTTQRAAATTDFVVLLAAWCLFLIRHTGQRDLTVGTMVSGRSHPDTAALIGFFVNTLALRIRIDTAADFPALVAHVRQVTLDAFAHQDIPFEHVVRAIAPRRSGARNPLFTTSFAYAPATTLTARNLPAGLTLNPLPAGVGGSHFDLSLTAARTPEGLVLRLVYSTDLYDQATIGGYLHSLTDLLAALAARPAAPLNAFLEPTPREAALLAAWSQAHSGLG
ncbi:MAG TPA: amino acid adenylation domain-containing protein [Streptosporangiaceae bacterium]|nr:amino acid adenylation domain-containing protein [Streptosporangiaceae bacterium]